MAKEFRTLLTEIKLPYELAYGATWTKFFEGMKEKKIYGTKCSRCGRICTRQDVLPPLLCGHRRVGRGFSAGHSVDMVLCKL